MKNPTFVNGEYYHIYNRGVDKRTIFGDENDLKRFFQSMKEFNTIDPIGSIYLNNLNNIRNKMLRNRIPQKEKLVEFICYCLNPNHYHFILQQTVDKGIAKFMHKLGLGYTNYFNEKHKRNGSLCQGKYKAIHVNSNEYLLHLSAYVNLNHKIHNFKMLRNSIPQHFKSSWEEYIQNNDSKKENGHFCEKDIILSQFGSAKDYKEFAEDSLKIIKENKEIKKLLLE